MKSSEELDTHWKSDVGIRLICLSLIHFLIAAWFYIASAGAHTSEIAGTVAGIIYVFPLWVWGTYSLITGMLMLMGLLEQNKVLMGFTAIAGFFYGVVWFMNYLIIIIFHSTHLVTILATPWLWLWYAISHLTLARVLLFYHEKA